MANISGMAHLKIVKGIAKIPGDSGSSETGLDELNLLDIAGFACDEYQMRIPALKSSAIYADNPLIDGRTLISGTNDNVKEIIRLTLSSSTIIQMAAMLSKLGRMKQDCNDYWDTYTQIDPVYLKHQVVGEPGPRYALLYDIEVDVESPINPADLSRTVTLNIEREPYWRGLAPGDNPKKWTRLFLDGSLKNYNTTSAQFMSAANNLAASSQVYNVVERLNSTTIRKQNYIDVPASSIPGDAPALTSVVIDVINANKIFISRTTKSTSVTLRDNVAAQQTYHLAAAHVNGGYGTDTTLANDAGSVLYPPGSGNARRATISFATDATNVPRVTWINTAPTSFTSPAVDENMFRGRFMVFARCRQTSGNFGDVKMSLRYGTVLNNLNFLVQTTEVSPTVLAGAGDTTSWPVTYMGVIDLPVLERVAISPAGYGISAPDSNTGGGSFRIVLYARRTTGASTLFFSDLIFIPIDEQCAEIISAENSGSLFVLDSSTYFTRGKPGDFAAEIYNTGAPSVPSSPNVVELRGQALTLIPGVNNRIYFFQMDASTQSDERATNVIAAYINIIPRWTGLRDV